MSRRGEHWLDVAKRVVREHQHETHRGVILDATTANMLVSVNNALSEQNQAKFQGLDLVKAVHLGWKLVS